MQHIFKKKSIKTNSNNFWSILNHKMKITIIPGKRQYNNLFRETSQLIVDGFASFFNYLFKFKCLPPVYYVHCTLFNNLNIILKSVIDKHLIQASKKLKIKCLQGLIIFQVLFWEIIPMPFLNLSCYCII